MFLTNIIEFTIHGSNAVCLCDFFPFSSTDFSLFVLAVHGELVDV